MRALRRTLRRQLRIWKNDFLSVYLRLTTFHRTAAGLLLALALISAARHYWFQPLLADIQKASEEYAKSEPPEILPSLETDTDIQETVLKIEGRKKSLAERKKEAEKTAKSKPKITPQNKTDVLSQFGTLIAKANLRLLDTRPASSQPLKEESPPEAKKNNVTKNTKNTKSPKNTKSHDKLPAGSAVSTAARSANTEIPNEVYDYLIEGDYRNMLTFLQAADKFEYPVRINHFRLGFPERDPSMEKLGAAKSTASTGTTPLGTVPPERRLQLKFQLILYFH